MRRVLSGTILFVCITGCFFTATGQRDRPATQTFSVTDLQADFQLLRDTMVQIHPAMYRYSTKENIDRILDSCFALIGETTTLPDFYLLTRRAVAAVGDGHANSKLPRNFINEYWAHTITFPAMIMFIHGKAFVFCCKQQPALNGKELISINGRLLADIVPKLFTYISTDGRIESRKNWELPEDFHFMYNTVYGSSPKYAVLFKTTRNGDSSVVLQADSMKNFLCESPFRKPTKYLLLRYTANHTAVLTLHSFFDGFLEQTKENFKEFLDSAFRDMIAKKTTRLLIDVRGNQGGNDQNGAILYSYLTHSPFGYYQSLESIHEQLKQSEHSLLGLQQPNDTHYEGKLFILINGRSFSGVAEFASVVKNNHRGTFIGEECGGGYWGNSSGNETMVTLPHTGITARIPLIKYVMAVNNIQAEDGGFPPDYPVELAIGDLISGADGQLEYALKVAEGKQKTFAR